MRGLIVRWIINGLALYLTAHIIEGINIESFIASLFAAFILGLVNAVIRPIINILTLPINFLTLGLFTLVINGFMLWLVGDVVAGFEVQNVFFAGIFGAIVLSIISGILTMLIKDARG
ncbi:MAG: hypothetical protein CVU88_06795 [Firmicutes bacterium HGW-Firmicutes-13]|nr:MAG: hypothetical protein CVU88_06795 [Firmicutes bacterium HGW-Firmicutes-13]